MKKILFPTLTLTALILASCNSGIEDISFRKVSINFDNANTVAVKSSDIIELETNDSSLLYDVCRVLDINGKYVVHSRNKLKAFDSNGRYLRDIGREGHSGTEYQMISNVFKNSDTICVYDFNTASVISYDINGKFLKRLNLRDKLPTGDNITPPSHLYKNGDKYVSVNCFGGDQRKIPALSIISGDLKSYNILAGKSVDTGFWFPDDISFAGDKILYWLPMCDTLYVANEKEVKPYCFFDFGKYAFPEEMTRKDPYERMDYINKKYKDGEPFAGAIRYYSSYGKFLYFVCMAPDNKNVLCRYDTDSNEVNVYGFDFPKKSMKIQNFLYISGDNLYLAADDKKDESKNPCLIKMEIKDLE